ncbi:uncharacterized protein LOC129794303 [Lutzomyia longipalpis]|uniref:uncharacterized protein LOC129794303 n=1 Tax=Lutzomyia longipalpis TaxID=7200 RepID=UPI002483D21D|nr:uncharacterized protein LOC129794303 [Lutzomyia longipalpis]
MAKNAATEPVLYGKKPDVLFIFPEDGGKKIFAEKLRLAQVSEVFKKQFSGSFDCKEDILIKDISFEIFEIILDYIHDVDDEDAEDGEDAGDNNDAAEDNEIEISEYNFLEILYMASKYFIFPVIEKVIEFVCPYITADNLLYYYEALSNYQIKKLNDKFQDIFEHHPIKIIDGLNGSEVHMGILKQILESSCLKIDTEYNLYAAVATMMKRVSKDAVDVADEMRKKMGNLIYLIRFPL